MHRESLNEMQKLTRVTLLKYDAAPKVTDREFGKWENLSPN